MEHGLPACPMIGRTLAHYRVLEQLGEGGMGAVYLAEDTRLRRKVALKVLPPSLAGDPERLERFAREAEAVANLNHPNIVTVYSIEHVEGRPILVMELLDGHTLTEEIPRGGLPDERFFELAIPLADAVSAAHERGVTHRDLKPSNIMVTRDGRIKVVDFGLAKLRVEAQARELTAVLEDELTEPGRILGTYPYMSPEQIKGKPADYRADIFSLGVVLYEMGTGERPFSGESSADLISSILRDEPPPAHERNPDLPHHLHRILTHCLEKDPDRRFQTAKDLRNELESLRHEIRSERLLRSTSLVRRLAAKLGRGRRRWLAAAGLVLALAVAATALFVAGVDREAGPAALVAAAPGSGTDEVESRSAIAVLFFQNLTGDPELEWLRTGLTEMLVTDLSQSPGLRVLSTDRLYQVLRDLGRLDDPVVSADLVRSVARQTQVGTVLLGSYLRVGDTLHVNATLQNAADGEILGAQRVEGAGESGVFTVVDRLSGRVLRNLERSGRIASDDRPHRDQGIEAVTTSSVEAYRVYAEGIQLVHEVKLEEAVPLLERAVELDPEFAMAHAQLARVHEILGREPEYAAALERAFALASRLPLRERSFVQGSYHGRVRATYGRAIATLEAAVDLYPDHHAARYLLGLLDSYLELHEEATRELEELLRRGYDPGAVYNALAGMYAAAGRPEEARALLDQWQRESPDRWSVELVAAWQAVNRGDVETARESLRRTEELRPGSPFIEHTRWRLAVVTGRWDEAADATAGMIATDDPYWRWRGSIGQAVLELYRGRPRQALEAFQEARRAYGGREPLVGTGCNLAADLLLDLDRAQEARDQAATAREVAQDDWPAWEGTFWAALAHQRSGDPDGADVLARELAGVARDVPGPVEERLHHRLLGLLAFERGDAETALRELEQAEALLPPRGLPWHRHRLPDHVDVWYELAAIYRHLGRSGEALERYRRVVESGTEHAYHPVEYVRSHYFLGRLLEERGDRGGAREAYRAFLGFWGDGDLDPERVEDARDRLGRLGG